MLWTTKLRNFSCRMVVLLSSGTVHPIFHLLWRSTGIWIWGLALTFPWMTLLISPTPHSWSGVRMSYSIRYWNCPSTFVTMYPISFNSWPLHPVGWTIFEILNQPIHPSTLTRPSWMRLLALDFISWFLMTPKVNTCYLITFNTTMFLT